MRKTRVLIAAAAAANVAWLLAGTERDARAGGITTARFGADHGQAALANPYAVYFNPAALGGMEGTQIQVDGTVAVRSIEYTRAASALTPSDANASTAANANYKNANSGDAKLLNIVAAPFVGFATDFGTKSFHLGFATYIPFGGSAQWDQNQAYSRSRTSPGAIDGVQRWSDISGQVTALYNTLALAYRFEKPRLSIGVSASLISHSVHDVRARNLDGSDDVFSAGGSQVEGRALLEVSGIDLGASVGVYWEPLANRTLRLGLSYTSQPGFGQMRLSGQLNQQLGSIAQVTSPTNVDFLQQYPDIVRLGAAWRLAGDFEVRADVDYERWSVFKRQCVVQSGGSCNVDSNGADLTGGNIILNIPRNWHDTVSARAGFGYFLNASEIFASVNGGTSAAPKSTLDPAFYDANNFGFTAGLRQRITDHFFVAGSYNYIYFLPVDNTGQSQAASFVAPSRSPNTGGHYSSEVHFLNINLNYKF